MKLGITGKWALVCGASKGLGYGCAQALAREGAHVVIVARGAEALQAAAGRLRGDAEVPQGTQVEPIAADITTTEGRATVFAFRKDYDIVVTNAGGPPPGDFRAFTRDDWLRAIDANMLTPIELVKATIDGMIERRFGRIVNITSSAVKAPIDVLGLSNGARSGLTGFVAGLARKVARHNVTINNLLPGPFDTDRLHAVQASRARATGVSIDDVRASEQGVNPAGRFGTPEEFGATCAFLCSVHAGFIVGQNVLIDGGQYPGTF